MSQIATLMISKENQICDNCKKIIKALDSYTSVKYQGFNTSSRTITYHYKCYDGELHKNRVQTLKKYHNIK